MTTDKICSSFHHKRHSRTFNRKDSFFLVQPNIFYQFLYPLSSFLLQVIGGDLQERLIPVPYSKSTTDQAVREIQYVLYCCSKSFYFISFLFFDEAHQIMHQSMYIFVWMCIKLVLLNLPNFYELISYAVIIYFFAFFNIKNVA